MEWVIIGVGFVSLFIGYRVGYQVASKRAVNYMLAAFSLYTQDKDPDGQQEMLHGVREILQNRHAQVALLGRMIGESVKFTAKP